MIHAPSPDHALRLRSGRTEGKAITHFTPFNVGAEPPASVRAELVEAPCYDLRAAPSAPKAGGTILARLRLHLTYTWRHRRRLSLDDPRLFTELIQHRKLHDRDPRLPLYADKLRVKGMVAAALGPDWVIPTWWHGEALPARPSWPMPFVVKSRHGCKQIAFVRSPELDWQALRVRADRWVARPYGYWLDEWLYTAIPRGLLVEPFMGQGGELPVDYKLFVFGGEVTHVQVHLTREHAHRWLVLDRDWRPMVPGGEAPPRPPSLPAMIAAAHELARGFAFVRIDFYEIAGSPKFGEMTFYPGSGLDPMDPPQLDAVMGDLWRKSLSYTDSLCLPESRR